MLDKLNHIAIAVPNLEEAISNYKKGFNVKISDVLDLPDHGVRTAFIELINTNIELIAPLGEKSPILNFLRKNVNGGIHHICYQVSSIDKAIRKLQVKRYELLGEGIPRIGAHGKKVVFIHPKEFNGTLIELEEF